MCKADGHVIKRTLPIRADEFDETGAVYFGKGGLRVAQRVRKLKRWFLQKPGMARLGHHAQKNSFPCDRLVYRCVLLEDGEVLDAYSKSARNHTRWQCDR